MITDRIGGHGKFCYQLIITLTKFMIYKALFKIKTQEIPRLLLAVKKKIFKRARLARTVQLLRHDAYRFIKAEIRAVDNQSDLRILV